MWLFWPWRGVPTLCRARPIRASPRPLASVAGKPAASFAGLTALDYIEIQQLVSRYAYAVDTGADNGNVYASLFAPDGAFADRMGRETKGREALAALARRNTRGPQSAFHFIVNHVIEPTSEGAVGKEYSFNFESAKESGRTTSSEAGTTRMST